MVKKIFAVLLLFAIIILLAGCDDTKFWCDYCHAWYNGLPYNVTIGTVDYILCQECYEEHISDVGTDETSGTPTEKTLKHQGHLLVLSHSIDRLRESKGTSGANPFNRHHSKTSKQPTF